MGTGKSEDPLAHSAKYAVIENVHVGHFIGSKEEQKSSFCTAECKVKTTAFNLNLCFMAFSHKRRHPNGYYDFPFGRWGRGCIYLENFKANLRNAYCLSDPYGCFFCSVFCFCRG